ncbi:MAG: PKD domain-containing protein [Bacteroidia bacterium]
MIRHYFIRIFAIALLLCPFIKATASTASFTYTYVCEGSNTLFQSTSTASSGTIIQWIWDFDYDGQFDDGSGQSVNYVFPASGSYLVGLRITTDLNETVQTYLNVVINPVAVASFTASEVCAESATSFTDNSTIASPGVIEAYAWDFDNDGNYDNGTGASAEYQFAGAGTYTVGLQVTSDSGCVSVTHGSVIVNPNPTANFSFTEVCLGASTHLTGSGTVSSGSIVSYAWELNGDGQYNDATGASIYNEFINAGNYQVGLRVTTNKGCTTDTVGLVIIAPIPYINYSFEGACTNTPVSFTNLSFSGVGTMSYTWNFGDTTATSSDVNPVHSYASPGQRVVTLIGISSYGCTDTTEQTITINGTPISDFTADDVCLWEETEFNNSAKPNGSVIESYYWNFDDGGESVETNPVHLYTQPGTYTVMLVTYSTQGCIDTVEVDVNVWANPVANITTSSPTEFCIGGSVTLSIDPGNANVLWSNASDQNSITVDAGGSYNVLLYDEHGCKDRDTVVVTVYQLPTVVAGPDTSISAGFSAQLWATGAQDYVWTPADYLDNTVIAEPTSTPLQTITYTATGTDVHGCVNSDEVTVTVNYDYTLVTYNLFSPNSDGVNDFFEVMNVQLYPDCEVVVYNRLGSPVFSSMGYQNNWDGTFNGEQLPDATYYYVIKCTGTEKIYTGPISILR